MDTVRLIDHVIDEARVIKTDHVPPREHISFHMFTFLYLLLDEETLEILDVDHYLKTDIKSKLFKKHPLILQLLKYTCYQPSHVQVGFTPFTYIHKNDKET